MKSNGIKKVLLVFLGFIVSAVLLTVIQPPISFSVLAWVALVPFIMACSPKVNVKILAILAYSVSLCYWLGNLYWVYPITLAGWLAFCLYTALLWPGLVICFRYCRMKKLPLFITVPILVVGAERLQGLFLGGFFWRHLSHSQYANITLIQIADIFGAAGLSFLIAMVNGLIAELILYRSSFVVHRSGFRIALVAVAVIATVAYGRYRVSQEDEFVTEGPLVAALQSNVPQSVKESGQASDEIFRDLLKNSEAAAQAGAELIIWPETMVQATLDPRVLEQLSGLYHCKIVDKILRQHAKDTAFVLVGAYGGALKELIPVPKFAERYNSVFLYTPDGTQSNKQYSKIHLVPFGEYVPFRKSFPFLYNILMKFTPYDFDYSLDAGKQYTVFEMTRGPRVREDEKQIYKFSVMICYEGTIPAIARRFAVNQQGQKQVDWLANISNDGWFVKFVNGQAYPSTELAQHAAIYVFRAVENRLSIIRSVNTGISCLIDSLGRIRDGFVAASPNFPYKAMERQGMAGWFADKMPIDKRVTFFSRYGQWLDLSCAVGFVGLVIIIVLEKLKIKIF